MSRQPEELLEEAQRALEMALTAGADDAVAGLSWSSGFEHEWRGNKLEKVQESRSCSLGVTLFVDGRYSTHATSDLDPGRLKKFMTEAVALTRHLEIDPHRQITAPDLYEGRSTLDLEQLDPALLELTRPQRLEWCQELEAAALEGDDGTIISMTASVSDGHSQSARASSNGFSGTAEGGALWLVGEISARDGDKRPEAFNYAGGIQLGALPSPASIGLELRKRVGTRMGAAKIPSLRSRLVLHPEAGSSFLGRLIGAMSGGAIQQKRSFLADKLGQRIGSPLLDWTDDPLRVGGLGSHHFDGEGIASRSRKIIEEGVLASFFIDTYYGSKLGWDPTTGGSSNLIWKGGPRDLEAIVADTQDGILLTNWLGGNANMTTGDFSFGFQGQRLKDGARAESLTEMNVSGNYGVILQQLSEVGSDPLPWARFATPSLVFEDVQFSGL